MRSLWCCTLVVALLRAVHAEPPPQDAEPVPGAPAIPDKYLRLFEQLDADDFQVRTRAEEQLHSDGVEALSALEQAAGSDDVDDVGIQPAIFRLIERIWIEAGPDIADAAELALDRLAYSDNVGAAQRARAVLSGNHRLRTRRAVAAIRELGGRVEFMNLNSARGGFFGPGGDIDFAIPGLQSTYIHVWLLRTWQGGANGLWHLARLEDAWSARLWRLDVTNVRRSGVPQEAVLALAARIPHLQVDERGASLGITSLPTGDCQITQVLPNGAAARAGLQPGDIVTRLDDIPIAAFGDLVGNLLDYEPGQQAVLKIERDGQPLDIPITLGGWQDLNVNDPPARNFQPLPAPNNRIEPPRER